MNEENINKKIKICISLALTIIWAGVIYYFSDQPDTISTIQSHGVIYSFAGLLGREVRNMNKLVTIDGILRESAHGVEFCLLAMLVYNSLYLCLNYRKQEEMLLSAETGVICTDKFRNIKCFLCGLVICTIYALTDEIHQIPVPGRAFELIDLFIDITGIIIGLALMYLIRIICERKRRNSFQF